MSERAEHRSYRFRHYLVLTLLLAGFSVLAARAAQLQLLESRFLQSKGNVNYLTVQVDHASRGMILDRHGEPLAVSSPIDSVVADPKAIFREGVFEDDQAWAALATVIDVPAATIKKRIARRPQSEFAWLKRHVEPERARRVEELDIPGVTLRREYKRYYPGGPVFGHLVGFTAIGEEEKGLRGAERMFDQVLSGRRGETRVLRDGRGRAIEYVEQLSPTVEGKEVRLSIDARIQYLAFRHLKAAYTRHRADAASAVVLDARTGEILALVNEPTINPNNRSELGSDKVLNQALQAKFEPGSTIKPFTIAAALSSGLFVPDSKIDTDPGVLRLGGYPIRDIKNYGLLTVSRVLIKSSNVGAAKIALKLDPATFRDYFPRLGFERQTGVLAIEATGKVDPQSPPTPRETASLSYGYGVSTNLLQLARAYTVLAGDGRLLEVRLTPGPARYGERVFQPEVVREVQRMMEKVTAEGGTAVGAELADYSEAGKTGTSRKYLGAEKGYAEDQYVSVFAGYAPAEQPRLIMVVMVDNPKGDDYFGGQVAAPVFARVMNGALHLLNVPYRPDPPTVRQAMADAEPKS